MKELESLERFYQLVKSNRCLTTHRIAGEHGIYIYPVNRNHPLSSEKLNLVRLEIEENHPDLIYTKRYGGLKVTTLDYSQILSDSVASHIQGGMEE